MPGLPSPRLRIAALSPCSEDGSGRHSSLPFLLRLALLVWMNGSLIQPPYPLSLLSTWARSHGRTLVEHMGSDATPRAAGFGTGHFPGGSARRGHRSLVHSLPRAAFLVWAGLKAASDFGPSTTARIVVASAGDALRSLPERVQDRMARRKPGETILPGLLGEVRETGAGARFSFEAADLEASFLAPDVLQITWRPGTDPVPYAHTAGPSRLEQPRVELVAHAGGGDGGVAGDGGAAGDGGGPAWLLRTAALEMAVALDGSIEIAYPGGPLLRRYLPPRLVGGAWEARHEVRAGEHLSGLGEQAARLDLFGGRFRLWNRDPGGTWGPGKGPLYMGIPVVVGAHPQGSVLAFYESSAEATFDFSRPSEDPSARGQASMRFASGALRYYLVAGELDRVMERYCDLTGLPSLPPRWAFGYHQSRWGYKTEADVREVVEGFEAAAVPLSSLHLDIDYMDSYRVFTIDERRFPDMAALTSGLLADHGTRLVTILDPGVKADWDTSLYRAGRELGVFCSTPDGRLAEGLVWPGRAVFPDFTSPVARDWWGQQYEVLLDAGVAGFWHDMNEPTTLSLAGDKTLARSVRHAFDGRGGDHAEAHNVYGLLMNRAGYEGLRRSRPEERPFVVSRSGWAGLQRYAWNWTGDTESSWGSLRQQVATIIGLGMSGVPFSGPDIGGFSGAPDAELYERWLQLGVFLPFCRTHSVIGAPPREPWRWPEPERSRIASWIRFRYRLLPYLYTLAHEAAATGAPIVRPLAWPSGNAAGERDRLEGDRLGSDGDVRLRDALWDVDDAFLLGDALLVAPVTKPGATSRRVLLPPGEWRSWWDGDDVGGRGGEEVLLRTPIERPAVLVRSGSIIPLDDGWSEPAGPCRIDADNEQGDLSCALDPMHAPRLLAFHCWPSADAEAAGTCIDDAGDGYGPVRIDRLNLVGSPSRDGAVLTWRRDGEHDAPGRVRVALHGAPWQSALCEGRETSIAQGSLELAPFDELHFS